MGLDLDEHDLTEAERSLKRLGITHVWRTSSSVQSSQPDALQSPAPHVDKQAPASTDQPQADRTLVIPPLLRALFHGKQSPVASLWTYHGLLEDMRQPQTPERLSIFRKIQETACTHLNWRERDICSWPLDIEPELFKAGLDTFRPKIVICMGTEGSQPAISVLEAGTIRHLPDLDEMSQGNRDAKNEAWRILRAITHELFPS